MTAWRNFPGFSYWKVFYSLATLTREIFFQHVHSKSNLVSPRDHLIFFMFSSTPFG